jgi:hypothetical protein
VSRGSREEYSRFFLDLSDRKPRFPRPLLWALRDRLNIEEDDGWLAPRV